jgi:hypothetical protein
MGVSIKLWTAGMTRGAVELLLDHPGWVVKRESIEMVRSRMESIASLLR